MAADWGTFITKVSDKLTSQSIGSYEEMADFLRMEYISATVGKAASPYGQTHVRGSDNIMFDGFRKGFKILYEGGDLTFEDKKTSPAYADLDVQPPTIDVSDAADQVDLDFRDWTEENKATIPPFVYSQFFSQYPNFPKNKKQSTIEIARKILHEFNGESSYLQWMYSLRTGSYSDWGNLIMDEVIKILRIEVDRPLQPGDTVRGYAKYRNKTETSNFSPDVFESIKGDINVDNTDEYSDTYKKRTSRSERDGFWKGDLINGKVVSVSTSRGVQKIMVSYFSKQYNRTFIKELMPDTVNRKIAIKDITDNLPSVSITDRIFQEQHRSNPNKIPDYLTSSFIINFTYTNADSGYLREMLRQQNFSDTLIDQAEIDFEENFQYGNEIIRLFSRNPIRDSSGPSYSGGFNSIFGGNIGSIGSSNIGGFNNGFGSSNNSYNLRIIRAQRNARKIIAYAQEEERYRNLRIRWINEIAEAARKNEDPNKPEDGYNVMAKGVIDYWKSCVQQPLRNEPAAPPCVISAPQGGLYTPIYYGSQTMLGNNIKRAFNTGKRFTKPPEKQIAAKMIASALAYSFSMHLLELKFIYRGGIPGPNGPIPMIGFVPLVY
jgi:hypothetical protein